VRFGRWGVRVVRVSSIRKIKYKCFQTLEEEGSAHIEQEAKIHYRWHALYGRPVRRYYAEVRSGAEVVVVEGQPGAAIVVAAWMLDPAVCAILIGARVPGHVRSSASGRRVCPEY
jgi:hypothetical protein